MSEQNTPLEETPSGWDEDHPDAFTQLRTHSKTLAQQLKQERQDREAMASKLERFEKQERFQQVADEAKAEGVSFEDVADLPLDQITAVALRMKAEEKAQGQEALLADQAKAAGFDSVEAYRTALSKLGGMSAEEKQALVSQAAAATAGHAPPQAEGSLREKAAAAFREKKMQGLPDEQARAAATAVLMEGEAETA